MSGTQKISYHSFFAHYLNRGVPYFSYERKLTDKFQVQDKHYPKGRRKISRADLTHFIERDSHHLESTFMGTF